MVLLIQRNNWLDYAELKLGLGLLLSWGFLVLYFLLGYLSFQLLDRYRYIYAIQQFLNYQVTEQWICIGEDVFPSGSDPYFRQLRKKCIDHGIGLLVINHQLQVTPLFTAKRKSFKANQNNTIQTRQTIKKKNKTTKTNKTKKTKQDQTNEHNSGRWSDTPLGRARRIV